MSNFSLVATTSTIFSGAGALIGYGVGGPTGLAEGAKAGLAMGVQVGVIAKGEKAVDAVGEKVSNGIDKAAEKVGVAADKTGEAIQKICGIGGRCLEEIADVWSKMALTGYCLDLAMSGAKQNLLDYNTICKTALDSLGCFNMNLTNLSLNTLAIASTLALCRQVYWLAQKREDKKC